ncbi:GntR family transcriptional regulator [Alsobacter sp. SYSU M60028]|uniref:GntR family transcriptional regulator n=1 Tax=Alsobacter ponti TaxID=2962936 RepID=A0ABT1LIN9_9HYPH|nr:GntR family transcriptional regulator [Alsobacter ponti]
MSRSTAVYRTLKRAIIEQALAPGAKLPEDSIGERLGVSRTLVREALLRLDSEGLVELRPNRGACVAQPSLEDGKGIFAVREALERLVVQELAGKLTPEQRRRIEAHVAEEEKAAGRDTATSIRLAGEFHTLLAEMTANALLARYVNEVVSRCSLILALYGRPHSAECGVSEHREVLAALLAGDPARAGDLMTSHLHAITHRALLPGGEQDIRDVLSAYAKAEGL